MKSYLNKRIKKAMKKEIEIKRQVLQNNSQTVLGSFTTDEQKLLLQNSRMKLDVDRLLKEAK